MQWCRLKSFSVQCAVCTVHCTLCNVQCALYNVHCAVSTVHCTVSTVHCTVPFVSEKFRLPGSSFHPPRELKQNQLEFSALEGRLCTEHCAVCCLQFVLSSYGWICVYMGEYGAMRSFLEKSYFPPFFMDKFLKGSSIKKLYYFISKGSKFIA